MKKQGQLRDARYSDRCRSRDRVESRVRELVIRPVMGMLNMVVIDVGPV